MRCATKAVDPPTPSADPTIYIVDDDEAVRDSLSLLLESHGMQVESYGSATSFLAEFRRGGEGCLLLDLHMPDIGGIDLLERFGPRMIDIPVVVISGKADSASRARAIAAGAKAVLDKPFRDMDLISAIQSAMSCFRA
jgi:two-component system response regulator FixJ